MVIDYRVTRNREQRAKEVLEILGFRHGLLLDVGSRNGEILSYFRKAGISCLGIDIEGSPDIRASGLYLPFKNETFNTYILNDVLEHIPYAQAPKLFSEAKRCLKTSGLIYVSVASRYEINDPHSNIPFLSWLPNRLYLAILKRLFHYAVYPYTVRRFKALMHRSGLSFKNYTGHYVKAKLGNLEYVGFKPLRPFIWFFKKIQLDESPGFQKWLEPFGVLVFVCIYI